MINQGKNHIWLPYTQMKNHLPQLEIKKARGSKIYLKNGKILIDGISSWWSVAHGYSHPHLIKSLKKQASTKYVLCQKGLSFIQNAPQMS